MSDEIQTVVDTTTEKLAAFLFDQPSAEPAAATKEIQSEPATPQPDNAAIPEEQPAIQDSEGIDDEAGVPEPDNDSLEEEEIQAEGEGATEPEPKGHYTVTVDGKPEKVTFDELKNGYLRQSDYTRKTAEHAQKASAEIEQLGNVKQHQIAVLEGLIGLLNEYNPLNGLNQRFEEAQAIGDTDTAFTLYTQIQKEQERQRKISMAYQHEQQQLQTQTTEKSKAEQAAFMEQQRKLLQEKLPGAFSDKGKEKFQSAVTKAMQKVGRDPKDVAQPTAADAMAYYYAGKYLESLESRPQTAEKLKGKAVMPQPGGRNPDSKAAKNDAALRQFKQRGGDRDALSGLLIDFGVV